MILSNLYRQIDMHKVITFDVYDTLIKRYVIKREDVFELTADKCKEYLGNMDYVSLRISAESLAHKGGKSEEITLEEIYEELGKKYPAVNWTKIQHYEEWLERNLTYANKEILDAFNYAIQRNKSVFIISDMYLSKGIISSILEHNGILGYQGLLVSSDIGLTKSSGNLFEYFIRKYGINKNDVLHVGDNLNSDVKQARLAGLDAYYYRAVISTAESYFNGRLLRKEQMPVYNAICMFINNTVDIDQSDAYQLGYKVYGPLLYGFSKWILAEIRKQKISKVFCFSRDGYIVSKALSELGMGINEKSTYFFTSRYAMVVPTLCKIATVSEFVNKYKSWPKRFNIKHVIEKLGLNTSVISRYNSGDKIKNKLFNKNTIIEDVNFNQFFEDVIDEVKANAQYQRSLLKRYFLQEGFSKKVAIVDLGGGGTIEDALRSFIQEEKLDVEIVPLYLLMSKQVNHNEKAYLYSKTENQIIEKSVRFMYLLIEIFFSANHGSVMGYKVDISGKIVPRYTVSEHNVKNNIVLNELHEGALSFIRSIRLTKLIDFGYDNYQAIQNLLNYGNIPCYRDLSVWDSYTFDSDGYRQVIPAVCSSFNIRKIKNNFLNAIWPMGYLMKQFDSARINKAVLNFYMFLNRSVYYGK